MAIERSSRVQHPAVRGWRRAALLVLKLSFVASTTLVLVEIGLRGMGIWPVSASLEDRDPRVLHPDPDVAKAQREGWIPWPTEVRVVKPLPEHPRGFVELHRNQLSLREDHEVPLVKPDGQRRIVCVGDSHTDGFCWNAESFPNQLELLLNAAMTDSADSAGAIGPTRDATSGSRVEVINAGFGPSSPYQQLWAYERVHRRLQPDVIVVLFYAGNDLLELLRDDDRVHLENSNGQWVHAAPRSAPDSTRAGHSTWEAFKQPLRDYSSTYHALTRITWLRSAIVGAAGDEYRDRLERATAAHAGSVWQNLNQAYYFRHHPTRWNVALEMQQFIMSRFRDLAREDGAELRYVVLPSLRQIHPESDYVTFERAISTLQLAEDDLRCDERACDAAVRIAQELGIPCYDLRSIFREYRRKDATKDLYYRFDHHLSVEGNRVVAEAVRDWLEEG